MTEATPAPKATTKPSAQPKPKPLTAAQAVAEFNAGTVISVVEDVSPGVQTKTVTIGGETFTMTIAAGTNKV